VQLETDIINFSYDRHTPIAADIRKTIYRIATTNVRIGILNNVEANIIVEPYIQVRTKNRGKRETEQREGFGDVILRSKINLWGNDGGETAFAVLPFVKLPTNSDDVGGEHIEGGVLFPFSMGLTEKVDLGTQVGVNFIKNDNTLPGGDYATELLFSVALSYLIAEKVTGYVESFNAVSSEGGGEDWDGSIGTGFIYQVNPCCQLDAGINIGVTRVASDFNPFLGVSRLW